MAVTTTIRTGPRSTELDGIDKAIESHPIWTELRGPVNVNSAENGVFLPANSKSVNQFGAAVHSTLHTRGAGGYYESVNELMLSATSASEVFDSLAYLRGALQEGGL
jgi:hypothetical protein